MMPDAIAQAKWEELIAPVDVIGEIRQHINQQLQEAQQQNREHLARVSEILARSFRDESRLLHESCQGVLTAAINYVRNDPRPIVACTAVREKFGPGTFLGDYFCALKKNRTHAEREAALQRLARKLKVRVIDPRARAARRRHGVKQEIFVVAVWRALERMHEEQTYRHGKSWIKTREGRRQVIIPSKYFRVDEEPRIVQYLRKEIRNAVERELAAAAAVPEEKSYSWDEVFERRLLKAALGRDRHEWAHDPDNHELRTRPEYELPSYSYSAEETLIHFAARQAREHKEDSALQAVLEKLSPREREVFALLDLETSEISLKLGVAESTVRVLKNRIVKKFQSRCKR